MGQIWKNATWPKQRTHRGAGAGVCGEQGLGGLCAGFVHNGRGIDFDPRSIKAHQGFGCMTLPSQSPSGTFHTRTHVCPRSNDSLLLWGLCSDRPLFSHFLLVFSSSSGLHPPTSLLTYRQQVVWEERTSPLSLHLAARPRRVMQTCLSLVCSPVASVQRHLSSDDWPPTKSQVADDL